MTNTISKFCPYAEFIHVDIDPASISKNVVVDVPIVGPVQAVLEEMVETLKQCLSRQLRLRQREDWWAQIEGWRDQQCLAVDSVKGVIKPQEAVKALYEVTRVNRSSRLMLVSTKCLQRSITPMQSLGNGSILGARNHGIWFALCYGRACGASRCVSCVYHGRRQYSDEYPRAFDLQTIWVARQDHQSQ